MLFRYCENAVPFGGRSSRACN